MLVKHSCFWALLALSLFVVTANLQAETTAAIQLGATTSRMVPPVPVLSPDYTEYRPELPGSIERTPVTLGQAIERALANDPDLMIERLEPQVRQSQVVQAEGDFDPELKASVRANYSDKVQNSLEFVSTGGTEVILDQDNREPRVFTDDTIVADVKITGVTHQGLRYEVGITEEQMSNDISRDSAVSLFDPEYSTYIGFKLTQPLLKGFGEEVQLAKIHIRQASRDISYMNLEQKVIDTLVSTISDYYDLLLAFQDFKVRQQKVNFSIIATQEKREQLERGMVVDRDLRQTEVELAKSYEQFLLGRQTLLTRSMELARRIDPELQPGKQRVFLPESGIAYSAPELVLEKLIELAQQKSPRFRAAQAKVANLEREMRYQEDQLRPELNLEFGAGVNAVASGVGRSLEDAVSGDGGDVSVGLVFNMPLGNRTASGRYQELLLRRNQARFELHKVHRDILIEIEKRSLAVRTQVERIEAVRRSVNIAGQALEHERDRLEKGQGNELAVKWQQQQLLEASVRELAATADLQKSLASLWALDGSLLGRYDIDMQSQRQLSTDYAFGGEGSTP